MIHSYKGQLLVADHNFQQNYAQYLVDVVFHVQRGPTVVFIPSLLKVTDTSHVSKALSEVCRIVAKAVEYRPINDNWIEIGVEPESVQ